MWAILQLTYSLILNEFTDPVIFCNPDAAQTVKADYKGTIISPNTTDLLQSTSCTIELTGISADSWIGIEPTNYTIPSNCRRCTNCTYVEVSGVLRSGRMCQNPSRFVYWKSDSNPTTITLVSASYMPAVAFNFTYRGKSYDYESWKNIHAYVYIYIYIYIYVYIYI